MEIKAGIKKESNGWEYYELKMEFGLGDLENEKLSYEDPVYYRNEIKSLLNTAKEKNLKLELKDKFLIISNSLGSYGEIANERVVINLSEYVE